MLKITEINKLRALETKANVCDNCGKDPSEHNVSARDRLVCGDRSGNEWKETKEHEVARIFLRLDDLERQEQRLRERLFLLTESEK